jgi:hypothetical protein
VVKDAFKKAYQQHFREVITDDLLSRFDMGYEEFKKHGRDRLNPEVFADISFQIRRANLGCTFLIYGFDDRKHPHLFTVTNPGRVDVYDKPGFWAIGKGATMALGMLAVLRHRKNTPLEEAVYNVLASKYASESASDVGPETWLFISKYGADAFLHVGDFEEGVRKIWEEKGRPRTNEEAVEFIKNGHMEWTSVGEVVRRVKVSKQSDAQTSKRAQ